MIRVDTLTKVYDTPQGQVIAVDGISFEIPAGEICVLLGPSGCGKTTTMKMINRLVPPSTGKIYLDGRDTDRIDLIELRRSIGYVIQQIGLFPNKTIEDNICVVPDLLGWDRKKSRARAAELLDMVGLRPDDFRKRYPRELSGGQQQRVGVIRALAADPPVMLMDEPFGAIDPINREVIQNEFLKMQQSLRKTIVFVSHDLDEAVKMADRIAIFRAGRIAQFASPTELLAAPASDFVRSFLGNDRALRQLSLVRVADAMVPLASLVRLGEPREKILAEARRHGLPVMVVADENGRPAGMADPHSGDLLPVRGEAPVSTDLRNAVATMFSSDMPVLPCVDADGVLKGVLSYGAIVRSLSRAGENHDVRGE